MKFSIKDFFSKCDQIRRKLRILSHLLKKSFMENFILCAVVIMRQIRKPFIRVSKIFSDKYDVLKYLEKMKSWFLVRRYSKDLIEIQMKKDRERSVKIEEY